MKLPTEKLRQVIRLIHDDSHSNRVIGMTVGVSPNTVKNVRDLLRYNHKNWDDLKELDNETLDKILWGETKKPAIRKPQPDWSLVHEELKKRDVTLELLWDEYRSAVPKLYPMGFRMRNLPETTESGLSVASSVYVLCINPETCCSSIFVAKPCQLSTPIPVKLARFKFLSEHWVHPDICSQLPFRVRQ